MMPTSLSDPYETLLTDMASAGMWRTGAGFHQHSLDADTQPTHASPGRYFHLDDRNLFSPVSRVRVSDSRARHDAQWADRSQPVSLGNLSFRHLFRLFILRLGESPALPPLPGLFFESISVQRVMTDSAFCYSWHHFQR